MVQVKNNQPKLYAYIENLHHNTSAICTDELAEKKNGKLINRLVKVYKFDETVLDKKWEGIKSVIAVERSISNNGEIKHENSYYISHLNKAIMDKIYAENKVKPITISAKFQTCIREHWGIENRLHWVKDVILNEDKNGIKNHNLAVNVAIFNTIGINILRENGFDSIKEGKTIFGCNLKEYAQNIRT